MKESDAVECCARAIEFDTVETLFEEIEKAFRKVAPFTDDLTDRGSQLLLLALMAFRLARATNTIHISMRALKEAGTSDELTRRVLKTLVVGELLPHAAKTLSEIDTALPPLRKLLKDTTEKRS